MTRNAAYHLNAILKGEHMAISSFEELIQDANEKEVKEKLQTIQMQHKENAIKLSERIQNLGQKPVKDAGMAAAMANTMTGIKDMIKAHPFADKLKTAYDGMDKGIGVSEDILERELDPESRKLVNEILSKDHDNLKTIEQLISQHEK